MSVLFENLINRVNEVREQIGLKRIPEMKGADGKNNYMPLLLSESMFENIWRSPEGQRRTPNLFTDKVEDILFRMSPEGQTIAMKEATTFRHIRRGRWAKGKKLELDYAALYSKYANEAATHIHFSPLLAGIKELISRDLIDPETGNKYNFNKSNHHAAKYLETWINKQVGIDNLNIPSGVKKGLNTLNRNLTAATLMLNFRTMLIQPTALLQTATLFGPERTLKGVTETALGKKHPAMEYSTELKTRVMDAAVADPANVIAGTAYQKGRAGAETVGMFGMKLLDGKSADATWRTAFDYYKDKNPRGQRN
jgi:hypothetical protein